MPTLHAFIEPGVDVLPRSKKAKALLALVALSEGNSLSRARAAAMLWSNLERADALARLRNTLHQLHQAFSTVGMELIRADDGAISLKTDLIHLHMDQGPGSDDDVLVDFDGLDPALDRWLTNLRLKHSGQRASPQAAARLSGLERRAQSGTRPSLAVLEFEGATATESRIAAAATEEVGSALARIRWFTTISRSPEGQRLSTGTRDFSKIADYLLVGTLQPMRAGYRLSLKLLSMVESGVIVWADDFEESSQRDFFLERDVALMVAARLDTELLLVEADQRGRSHKERERDAYQMVLAVIPAIFRLDRDPFLAAGHVLEEAIASQPESALANSWLAYWHMFLIGQGWAANPYQTMIQAENAAHRAMMLDPKDARAFTIAGHVKAFLHRRLQEAATLHEMAIQTNPALPLAWHLYGVTHAYAGRLEEAHASVTRALQLAPKNPHGFYAEGALGIIHLLLGDHEAAVRIGRRVTERHPQFTSAYKSYLAALGHLGRKSEAAHVLQRLSVLEPRFSLQRFRASAQYQQAEHLNHFMTGLRLAGVK